MKETFVMSVMGPDNAGTIKSIAEMTRKCGGEWTRSKIMRLDGQLTALMKVVIEQDQEAELKNTLATSFPEMQFGYAAIPSHEKGQTKTLHLVVDCKDRPGLTKELSRVLANLDLVVENMECNRVHVSSIGQAAFTARVELTIPEAMSGEAVADEIEALAEDVRVSLA